jgi:hypothetical protein
MSQWFKRLSDVPNIFYKTNSSIRRTSLRGHNARPEFNSYEFDGRTRTYVSWPSLDGSGTTSQAPCEQWITQPHSEETPGQTALRQLQEQLELPGTVENYGNCLWQGILALSQYRKDEPWVYEEVERICLLSISLLEAYPDSFAHQDQDGKISYFNGAASHLIRLYERSGYIREALAIAQRVARFGIVEHEKLQLAARLEVLEQENDN